MYTWMVWRITPRFTKGMSLSHTQNKYTQSNKIQINHKDPGSRLEIRTLTIHIDTWRLMEGKETFDLH